jgi:clan AA aspartic protease
MIVGRVLATGEAVVTLSVRGPGGQIARVQAMVDTGFNEHLTLPSYAIERLGLQFQDEAIYTLGDGEQSSSRVYVADVEWGGAWREMAIVEIEHDALLGTGAMMGCNLNINLVEGGRVEIRPLP